MGDRNFGPAYGFAVLFADVEGLPAAASAAKEFRRPVAGCGCEARSDGRSQRGRDYYAPLSGAFGVCELRDVRRVRLPGESQVEFGGRVAAGCGSQRTLRDPGIELRTRDLGGR